MRAEDQFEDGGSTCYFCGEESRGDIHDFYAGFCVDYQRNRAFLSNTVHIKATYRDLSRYGVLICENCAAQARQKRHLPGLIGWGLGAVACAIGAAIVFITHVGGDSTIHILAIFGLFGGLSGLLAALEALALFRPATSPAVTLKLLDEVKIDPALRDKGDSFFGPEEYKVMFKDAPAELPLAEVLSPGRRRGGKRRKSKHTKPQETKACPNCASTIPIYAQACPHCKKILA
jgi:hypothetical protein